MDMKATVRSPCLQAVIRHDVESVLPAYDGDYEVLPRLQAVTLPTKNKSMSRDMTVLAIPYYEVGNENGTTVIIGE